MVVPDGLLTNASTDGVRRWLTDKFQLLAVISLPQHTFRNFETGVKTSIILLRRLAEGEAVKDDDMIFMAIVENIGYDHNGRDTYRHKIETEVADKERVELLSSDLFDYRVWHHWSRNGTKKPGWTEYRREIIPDTGLAGIWNNQFRNDPQSLRV